MDFSLYLVSQSLLNMILFQNELAHIQDIEATSDIPIPNNSKKKK